MTRITELKPPGRVYRPKKKASRPPGKRRRGPGRLRLPPRVPRRPRPLSGPLAWIAGTLMAAAAAGLAYFFIVYPARPGPGSGRTVEFSAIKNESVRSLTERLHAAGLVRDPRVFAFYLWGSGGTARVAEGQHFVADDLSPGDLLGRLRRSAWLPRIKVTIPEGWTRFDIAKRLEGKRICGARAFVEASASSALLDELHIPGETAEGYLFPATYDLPPDTEPEQVVRRMKQEFDRRYPALEARNQPGLLDLSQSLGWGGREVMILASMIEKEAVADEERAVIASVFVNRLRDPKFKPKLLQCDPTAAYGCLQAPLLAVSCATYNGKVTHDIVADAANPYNTYKREGLPPGPIANPGAKSIEAAMSPSSTPYLYFVARQNGHHTFSETYADHNAAIRKINGR